MFSIAQIPVPAESLLRTHRGGARPERWGLYQDCFAVAVDRAVSLPDFVFAFYTSPVFRVERSLLALLGASSNDADARALADGSASSFAVWTIAERSSTQLLLSDRYEKTRSWMCIAPSSVGETVLQFGSAVAARRDRNTGALALGAGFRALLSFHVGYSQWLLHSARVRLSRPG